MKLGIVACCCLLLLVVVCCSLLACCCLLQLLVVVCWWRCLLLFLVACCRFTLLIACCFCCCVQLLACLLPCLLKLIISMSSGFADVSPSPNYFYPWSLKETWNNPWTVLNRFILYKCPPLFRLLSKRQGPGNRDDPCDKFLKFLDAMSNSSRKHEMAAWWVFETSELWTKKPRNQ